MSAASTEIAVILHTNEIDVAALPPFIGLWEGFQQLPIIPLFDSRTG
jgi:hypothetical protein